MIISIIIIITTTRIALISKTHESHETPKVPIDQTLRTSTNKYTWMQKGQGGVREFRV